MDTKIGAAEAASTIGAVAELKQQRQKEREVACKYSLEYFLRPSPDEENGRVQRLAGNRVESMRKYWRILYFWEKYFRIVFNGK